MKDRGLIDGIGVQGHRFALETAETSTLKYNLDRLANTGLPIYISELDLGNLSNSGTPNDGQQLQLYKKIFPVLWQHPGVKGITLWGYIEGQMWQSTCFLVRYDFAWRPAMTWLAQYIIDNPVGIVKAIDVPPFNFTLEQNYPNPFNPSTIIRYSVPKVSKVTLKVFDILGREVQTLVNNIKAPGQYSITFDAKNLATGMYFYQLKANGIVETKKFILQK